MTDTTDADEGWQWAIVEIFGHRKHAGRTREEERFGAKMLRIDVPVDGDPLKGWTTIYYGGASIFSFGLTDEASVMRANKPYAAPAITSYRRHDWEDEDLEDHEEMVPTATPDEPAAPLEDAAL